MLNLFVLDAISGVKIPAMVNSATHEDLEQTKDWQTQWTTSYAHSLPNKVALHRTDNNELLGLMSYCVDDGMLAVEIVYIESADHSNANLLQTTNNGKKYIGIAKALFAYAVDLSIQSGFDGVLVFKAKTSQLLQYYMQTFGATPVAAYDPFRLVIWEDAAANLVAEFTEEVLS